jgi:hypothetical protein
VNRPRLYLIKGGLEDKKDDEPCSWCDGEGIVGCDCDSETEECNECEGTLVINCPRCEGTQLEPGTG